MGSKRILIGGLVILLCWGVGLTGAQGQSKKFYSIGTARIGGTWYPIGTGIADVLNKNITGIQVTVEETAGAVENVRRIVAGDMEIGLTAAKTAIEAYEGTEMFKGKPKSIAGWFSIENRYQTSIALRNSGIKTVQDLKGKRVGIGIQGSANFFDGKIWIEGHGVSLQDIKPFYMGQAEQTAALKDGRIDVMLWTTGIPSAAIQELCLSREVYFIPTTQEAAKRIAEKTPYYKLDTLPAGSYKGMDVPYVTLLNNSAVVLKPALSEDLAYQMTKAIFENLPTLGNIHRVFKGLSLANAIETMPIPVHPGAAQYFREKKVPRIEALQSGR